METSNKRIAKNTIVLYLRQIVILLIGLYTSRVVLNTLGVVDYGLYNVVGGVVALFSFVTGAMGNATSRFITYSIGKEDNQEISKTFGNILSLYYLIGLFIFLLGETVGLWFVYNYLVIPPERFSAAIWVYHISILSTVISVLYIPYNSLIIAHEKMTAFAYIGMMDAALKLVIVFMLLISPFDKLIYYSILLLCIQLIDWTIYFFYCRKHFIESKVRAKYDKDQFYEILSFSGWTLFGNLAVVGYTQGINILLNLFFGPVVNAARGIAVTVQSITLNFVSNFQTAVNPQITKSFAKSDNNRMYTLLHFSSRISYILMFLLALPFLLKARVLLVIWLKSIPEYTIEFVILILIFSMLRSITNPINISVQATGNIKKYQLIEGSMGLLVLPIAYVLLKFFHTDPISVFWVLVLVELITVMVRIEVGIKQIDDSVLSFIKEVIVPIILTTALGIIVPLIVAHSTNDDIWGLLWTVLSMIIWTLPVTFLVGFNKRERKSLINSVMVYYNKRI